jgi:hypothetical protein
MLMLQAYCLPNFQVPIFTFMICSLECESCLFTGEKQSYLVVQPDLTKEFGLGCACCIAYAKHNPAAKKRDSPWLHYAIGANDGCVWHV